MLFSKDNMRDVYKDVTCGRAEEKRKRGQKLSCFKLAICSEHPR